MISAMKQDQSSCGYKYLFGPVASRRLGLSLGVDMIPAKVCSLNCVYCESGATTRATLERREYIPTEAIIGELDTYLRDRPPLDVVTFSGAGEPTLHSGIGRVIEFIKKQYPDYRVALLTNATLFPDAAVRAELLALNLVIPSLDAADDAILSVVNRPTAGVSAAAMIEGLVAFRRESKTSMWLEIFIVPGINDAEDHLERLREAALRIAPDRVQLNTLDRPGPEPWVVPADRAALDRIASLLQPLPVEIIARKPASSTAMVMGCAESLNDRIVSLVRRRPCTVADLVAGLGASADVVNETVRKLQQRKVLTAEPRERGVFFRLTTPR